MMADLPGQSAKQAVFARLINEPGQLGLVPKISQTSISFVCGIDHHAPEPGFRQSWDKGCGVKAVCEEHGDQTVVDQALRYVADASAGCC